MLKFTLVLFLISYFSLNSQNIFSPVSSGKAHATVATSKGLDAIFSNPACLDDKSDSSVFELSVYNFGGKIGKTYLNSSELNKIFGFSGSETVDRSELAQLLEDEKLFLNIGINLITAKLSLGNNGTLGINFGTRLYCRLRFDNQLVKLIETSNIGIQDYLITNKGVGGAWTREIGITYSKQFLNYNEFFSELSFGITPKLIFGIASLELDENSIISTNQINVRGSSGYRIRGGFKFSASHPDNFNLSEELSNFTTNFFSPSSGFGIGVNLGFQTVFIKTANSKYKFGVELQDLGKINWSNQVFKRSLVNLDDTITTGAISNDKFKEYSGELKTGGEFSTELPTSIRLGFGAEFIKLNISFITLDFESEFPLTKIGGVYSNPRFAIGSDMKIMDYLSLRNGFSFGGNDEFGIGFGIGLNPISNLKFDIGSSSLNKFFTLKQIDFSARLSYVIL